MNLLKTRFTDNQQNTLMEHPFILTGHDADGKPREIGFATLERAKFCAAEMLRTNSAGPAWLDYEIHGCHPETGEWQRLAWGTGEKSTLDK
jgi:hypothetical protein